MGNNLGPSNRASSSHPHRSRLVSDPKGKRHSKRPEGSSSSKSLSQRGSALPQYSASTDSLDFVGIVRNHQPSRTHEHSARRLQKWAEGGMPTENRTEAANRIWSSKQSNAPVTDLRGLGLQGLPNEIGNLTETRGLWLADNDLTRLPSSIGKLSSLQVLEADNNDLGYGSRFDGISEDIGRLSSLEVLDLHDNKLSTLPSSIGNLSRLRELEVSHNRLENLPAELSSLSQLERLSAHHNSITQVPGSMGVMSQLRNVDLSNNQLWNLPDSWGRSDNQPISLSESLRRLNLSDNNLQRLPNSFAKPPSQKKLVLDVSNNPIDTLPINYGGFTYADQPFSKDNKDNTITNHDKSVKAHVENTQVRQGLVDEGRLSSGRGVYAFGPLKRAQDRRPPAPMVDVYDADSMYSVEDFVEDHRVEGGIQNIDVVGPNAAVPMHIPRVPPGWAEQRASEWMVDQAIGYANRNQAAPPPLPENPVPQWDTAVPSAFRAAGSSSSASASFAARQAPRASLQPQFLENLLSQVQQLPPEQQRYIHQCVENMPPDQVVSELIRIQNTTVPNAYAPHPAYTNVPAQTHKPTSERRPTNVGNTSRRSQRADAAGSSSSGWAAPAPWAQKNPPEDKTLIGKAKSFFNNPFDLE